MAITINGFATPLRRAPAPPRRPTAPRPSPPPRRPAPPPPKPVETKAFIAAAKKAAKPKPKPRPAPTPVREEAQPGQNQEEKAEAIRKAAKAKAKAKAQAQAKPKAPTQIRSSEEKRPESQRLLTEAAKTGAQMNYDGDYTIRSGDSLYSIAKKLGVSVADLYAANRGHIGTNPNYILAGSKLVIPGGSEPAPKSKKEKAFASLAATSDLPSDWQGAGKVLEAPVEPPQPDPEAARAEELLAKQRELALRVRTGTSPQNEAFLPENLAPPILETNQFISPWIGRRLVSEMADPVRWPGQVYFPSPTVSQAGGLIERRSNFGYTKPAANFGYYEPNPAFQPQPGVNPEMQFVRYPGVPGGYYSPLDQAVVSTQHQSWGGVGIYTPEAPTLIPADRTSDFWQDMKRNPGETLKDFYTSRSERWVRPLVNDIPPLNALLDLYQGGLDTVPDWAMLNPGLGLTYATINVGAQIGQYGYHIPEALVNMASLYSVDFQEWLELGFAGGFSPAPGGRTVTDRDIRMASAERQQEEFEEFVGLGTGDASDINWDRLGGKWSSPFSGLDQAILGHKGYLGLGWSMIVDPHIRDTFIEQAKANPDQPLWEVVRDNENIGAEIIGNSMFDLLWAVPFPKAGQAFAELTRVEKAGRVISRAVFPPGLVVEPLASTLVRKVWARTEHTKIWQYISKRSKLVTHSNEVQDLFATISVNYQKDPLKHGAVYSTSTGEGILQDMLRDPVHFMQGLLSDRQRALLIRISEQVSENEMASVNVIKLLKSYGPFRNSPPGAAVRTLQDLTNEEVDVALRYLRQAVDDIHAETLGLTLYPRGAPRRTLNGINSLLVENWLWPSIRYHLANGMGDTFRMLFAGYTPSPLDFNAAKKLTLYLGDEYGMGLASSVATMQVTDALDDGASRLVTSQLPFPIGNENSITALWELVTGGPPPEKITSWLASSSPFAWTIRNINWTTIVKAGQKFGQLSESSRRATIMAQELEMRIELPDGLRDQTVLRVESAIEAGGFEPAIMLDWLKIKKISSGQDFVDLITYLEAQASTTGFVPESPAYTRPATVPSTDFTEGFGNSLSDVERQYANNLDSPIFLRRGINLFKRAHEAMELKAADAIEAVMAATRAPEEWMAIYKADQEILEKTGGEGIYRVTTPEAQGAIYAGSALGEKLKTDPNLAIIIHEGAAYGTDVTHGQAENVLAALKELDPKDVSANSWHFVDRGNPFLQPPAEHSLTPQEFLQEQQKAAQALLQAGVDPQMSIMYEDPGTDDTGYATLRALAADWKLFDDLDLSAKIPPQQRLQMKEVADEVGVTAQAAFDPKYAQTNLEQALAGEAPENIVLGAPFEDLDREAMINLATTYLEHPQGGEAGLLMYYRDAIAAYNMRSEAGVTETLRTGPEKLPVAFWEEGGAINAEASLPEIIDTVQGERELTEGVSGPVLKGVFDPATNQMAFARNFHSLAMEALNFQGSQADLMKITAGVLTPPFNQGATEGVQGLLFEGNITNRVEAAGQLIGSGMPRNTPVAIPAVSKSKMTTLQEIAGGIAPPSAAEKAAPVPPAAAVPPTPDTGLTPAQALQIQKTLADIPELEGEQFQILGTTESVIRNVEAFHDALVKAGFPATDFRKKFTMPDFEGLTDEGLEEVIEKFNAGTLIPGRKTDPRWQPLNSALTQRTINIAQGVEIALTAKAQGVEPTKEYIQQWLAQQQFGEVTGAAPAPTPLQQDVQIRNFSVEPTDPAQKALWEQDRKAFLAQIQGTKPSAGQTLGIHTGEDHIWATNVGSHTPLKASVDEPLVGSGSFDYHIEPGGRIVGATDNYENALAFTREVLAMDPKGNEKVVLTVHWGPNAGQPYIEDKTDSLLGQFSREEYTTDVDPDIWDQAAADWRKMEVGKITDDLAALRQGMADWLDSFQTIAGRNAQGVRVDRTQMDLVRKAVQAEQQRWVNGLDSTSVKSAAEVSSTLFDYPMKLAPEQGLRLYTPFSTWQLRNPLFWAQAFSNRPGLLPAIYQAWRAMESDRKQRNLTERFSGTIGAQLPEMGPFPEGYYAADLRTIIDVFSSVRQPFESPLEESKPSGWKGTLRWLIDAGKWIGIRPWPYIDIALQEMGVLPREGVGELFGPGQRLVEVFLKENGHLPPGGATQTGQWIFAFLTRRRISEMEAEGLITHTQSLEAMAGETGKIWDQAQDFVMSTQSKLMLLSMFTPFGFKFASTGEQIIRQTLRDVPAGRERQAFPFMETYGLAMANDPIRSQAAVIYNKYEELLFGMNPSSPEYRDIMAQRQAELAEIGAVRNRGQFYPEEIRMKAAMGMYSGDLDEPAVLRELADAQPSASQFADPTTGEIAWESYWDAVESFNLNVPGMSEAMGVPITEEEWQMYRDRYKTAIEVAFDIHRDTINQYWEDFDSIQLGGENFASVAGEYIRGKYQEALQTGMSPEDAQRYSADLWKSVMARGLPYDVEVEFLGPALDAVEVETYSVEAAERLGLSWAEAWVPLIVPEAGGRLDMFQTEFPGMFGNEDAESRLLNYYHNLTPPEQREVKATFDVPDGMGFTEWFTDLEPKTQMAHWLKTSDRIRGLSTSRAQQFVVLKGMNLADYVLPPGDLMTDKEREELGQVERDWFIYTLHQEGLTDTPGPWTPLMEKFYGDETSGQSQFWNTLSKYVLTRAGTGDPIMAAAMDRIARGTFEYTDEQWLAVVEYFEENRDLFVDEERTASLHEHPEFVDRASHERGQVVAQRDPVMEDLRARYYNIYWKQRVEWEKAHPEEWQALQEYMAKQVAVELSYPYYLYVNKNYEYVKWFGSTLPHETEDASKRYSELFQQALKDQENWKRNGGPWTDLMEAWIGPNPMQTEVESESTSALPTPELRAEGGAPAAGGLASSRGGQAATVQRVVERQAEAAQVFGADLIGEAKAQLRFQGFYTNEFLGRIVDAGIAGGLEEDEAVVLLEGSVGDPTAEGRGFGRTVTEEELPDPLRGFGQPVPETIFQAATSAQAEGIPPSERSFLDASFYNTNYADEFINLLGRTPALIDPSRAGGGAADLYAKTLHLGRKPGDPEFVELLRHELGHIAAVEFLMDGDSTRWEEVSKGFSKVLEETARKDIPEEFVGKPPPSKGADLLQWLQYWGVEQEQIESQPLELYSEIVRLSEGDYQKIPPRLLPWFKHVVDQP